MAGESQPPQGKPAKEKNIVGETREAERRARKREIDKQYRQRLKQTQQEVKIENEKLALANKQLKFENRQLKGEIQEKEQEIEQLKKENQEREQQWESNLKKCADGFEQLQRETHEKEQILKSMQESETRWKSMLDKMAAEANDKLLKSRSCSCSCGQQCKTDAIETEDLQINSELAQIRNERDNLKKQETGKLFQVGETFLHFTCRGTVATCCPKRQPVICTF
ncbi:hypothetical protein SLEP1_g12702 [Rubroshorea leprosula]|nr:hypothetical protein SLEP1_g12702 [Rubroshorea leprosula]